MALVTKTPAGKYQIDKKSSFLELTNNSLPEPGKSFNELIDEFDGIIKSKFPFITTAALSNTHGDWYEWFIAITSLNYAIAHNSSTYLVKLPKITQFDVARLYHDKLYNLIVDLREKLKEVSDVNLTTSNPDFVIVNNNPGEIPFNKVIDSIDSHTIETIDGYYNSLSGKCELNDIIGYVSVKKSFRPDRRLQIAHEGSLMKAIYLHLVTREWILDSNGIKYFAISGKVNDADIKALKTVATHSITNVTLTPQNAVDKVFKGDSISDLNKIYPQILY